MFGRLKRDYALIITSGGQLVLLVVGLQLQSFAGWMWCLGLMILVSVFVWYSALHRLRLVSGTPTSRIVSAAQGYVELIGKGVVNEPLIRTKYSFLPCLWCRYRLERKDRDDKDWHQIESGETTEPFFIDDGSGQCVVDPQNAEIVTQHKTVWTADDLRYTEWTLLANDSIYVLGEFKTTGGSSESKSVNDFVKLVLSEWKTNQEELHKRFDLDGNGLIDMREWELARAAALREAKIRLAKSHKEADIHFMVKPRDGRLFLVSNLDHKQLARRYKVWAWLHIVILFSGLIALGWLVQYSNMRM